ncbi:hypothetical protein CIC12_28865 [Burkholderia sp. SG-MS1]|uniref:FAD-dependent oxidoreductase n=1 Tax=Paraburkholderia sp. SG-MS1 TaxID=2023741 RepID=UPI0014470357|nr:FAD-dependent oxidoreductase [Paraburkholderia sp. SG-MS1]NKJ50666.1 hypothetical protein [Paraburkholderia sp. SG-MS1]
MIPSFHPVRRHREIAAGVRAEPRRVDSASGLGIKTLSELLDSSKKVRYPDAPFFSYPGMLAGELEHPDVSPFTVSGKPFWADAGTAPRVAIVGGGMSGLLCAWQLKKLGASVDIYEASAMPNGNPSAPQGAGRLRPANVLPNSANTRSELGCMRFPDTSYLFWHYLRLMVYKGSGSDGLAKEFTEFPNPGKIPTYLAGEKTLSPLWGAGGIDDLYNGESSGDLNYHDIQNRHIEAFLNVRASNNLTLNEVIGIMIGGVNDPVQLGRVRDFWKEISLRYNTVKYREFIEANGLGADLDVIGYLGVGTGGFAPLFETSVLEVMRLFVWNYESEYAVPDLYLYPFELKNKLEKLGVKLFYTTTVRHVSYNPNPLVKKYSIGIGSAESFSYDYVVCAMSHKAAYKLLSEGRPTEQGVVMPYSRVQYPTATSRFRDDIEKQQGMSSVKIFQTMGGPAAGSTFGPFSSVNPTNGVGYGRGIRVVFGKYGDAPLGVTYILPYISQVFQTSRAAVGLQYSWGNDSVRLINDVAEADANVRSALDEHGVFVARRPNSEFVKRVVSGVSTRVQSKTLVNNVDNGKTHPEYFAPDRAGGANPGEEGYFAIVNWDQVPQVHMGFKLDAPGIGRDSIYHFRFTSDVPAGSLLPGAWDNEKGVDRSVKNLYFCGCSFSQYGGWVEGAFQSALNATAGIVYAAAKDLNRLGDLSSHAKQLITGEHTLVA